MTFYLVMTTTHSEKDAEILAKKIIECGLSRCIQIQKGIRSIYHWDGNICDDEECRLMIKATEETLDHLIEVLPNWHPYDVPEIIAIPVSAGYKPYLQWLSEWKYNQTP